jgi:hypothetical protein
VPRLLALTIAAWMVAAATAAAAAPPPPLPGHLGFEAGPNSPVPVGPQPKAIATGYINGDDKLDFAVANSGDGTAQAMYNNGFGGFAGGEANAVGNDPRGIAVGDFNGDGRTDMATANYGSDTVSVMIQAADGSFAHQAGSPFPAGGSKPVAIAAGRLDDNASLDLVVVDDQTGTGTPRLVIFLADGKGYIQASGSPMFPGGTSTLLLEDVDEDGELDILTTTLSLELRRGLGDGTFAEARPLAVTGGRIPVAGDVDGDGHLDLVAPGSTSASNTMVLLGTGGGGFSRQDEFLGDLTGGAFNPRPYAIGRFNADPYGDFLGLARRVDPGTGTEIAGAAQVFTGDDDGHLTTIPDGPWPVSPAPVAIAVGDFNGDGKPDFAGAGSGPGSNTVSVLLNTTPWPMPQFAGDVNDFGDRPVGTISAVATMSAVNTGGEAWRVYRTEFAGANADDFIKTGDSCTGVEIPPGGKCSIRVRFAPSAEGNRGATMRLIDNTTAGVHLGSFGGVGTPPSDGGGGGTGPQGPPGPTGPAGTPGPPGTTGATGATGEKGTSGADGQGGGPGPQGATGAQGAPGATGPQGRPGRDATVRCKPKRSRSGDVRVTCTVRFASAARASVRARLVRGNTVYASSRRNVRRGRAAIVLHPRARLRHASYRLLLTFVDRKGRATTVSQRVRLNR